MNVVWILVLGIASSAWCVTAAARLSGTFDEATYIDRGLKYWQTGRISQILRLGTSPLPVQALTWPVHLAEKQRPQPWHFEYDFHKMLAIARAANLVFWWWLLIAVFLLAQHIAGPWAGRLSVAAVACEPNLLAHAALATTDISVTAALVTLALVYSLGRGGSNFQRIVYPGLAFGLALLCKASALVFGPMVILAIELHAGWPTIEGGFLRRLRETLIHLWSRRATFIQVGLIAFAVLLLGCGSDWEVERSFVKWADQLSDGPAKAVLQPIAHHLRIFSNGGEVLVQQIKHNLRGHGQFLLGESSMKPFWYYFPVLFTIKLPIAVLIGVGAAAAHSWKNRRVGWPLLAAIMLGLFSLNCRVQIGIRLQFFLVVLLIVGIATSMSLWRPRRLASALGYGGVAWLGLASAFVWPHGLCYVNELWGGAAHGHQLVSDSNYDWGQGLKELESWQRARQVPMNVWYFGTDPTVLHSGIPLVNLQNLKVREASDVYPAVHGKYLAVSTTLRVGPPPNDDGRRVLEFLDCCQPVDRTTTFWIYDFTEKQASARGNQP